MTEVFISYKRERRAHAKRLAAIIEAYGYDVWWDYNLLIDAGDYDAQIERRLAEAKSSIVLWCSGSRASGFVKDEARRANDLHKLLGVVIERGVEPPLGLGSMEVAFLVDWRGEPDAAGIAKLIAAIERLVGRPRKPRPNLLETLREAAPLPAVEPMMITEATDTNAPKRGALKATASSAETLLTDLRATWERLDKSSLGLVKRFKDHVDTVAPGSGLGFEVESVLETLTAQQSMKDGRRSFGEAPPEAHAAEGRAAPSFGNATAHAATDAGKGAPSSELWRRFCSVSVFIFVALFAAPNIQNAAMGYGFMQTLTILVAAFLTIAFVLLARYRGFAVLFVLLATIVQCVGRGLGIGLIIAGVAGLILAALATLTAPRAGAANSRGFGGMNAALLRVWLRPFSPYSERGLMQLTTVLTLVMWAWTALIWGVALLGGRLI